LTDAGAWSIVLGDVGACEGGNVSRGPLGDGDDRPAVRPDASDEFERIGLRRHFESLGAGQSVEPPLASGSVDPPS